MHSKMYMVRFGFEEIDTESLRAQIEEMIENYPYGSEIDYFQTMEEMAGNEGQEFRESLISGVVERLCEEYNADKVSSNKIKFTKENVEKYFLKKMDEAIEFIKTFKDKNDVNGFVTNHYHLTHTILDEEYPKYYSDYAYLEGEAAFIRAVYNKMRYTGVNEIEVEILDVWDFHF